ncbi:MAG: hypothetical protein RIF32_10915 [Leptospirales bacterium]|jgi:hypothetical protein
MNWKHAKALLFVAAVCLPGSLFAEKNVYIHGFQLTNIQAATVNECQGRNDCQNYWKDLTPENHHVHVGWKASMPWPYYGVPRTLEVLNNHCRNDYCQVICHSTGCPIVAYVLDKYSGYKIRRVVTLGSAEGGSELATYGSAVKILSTFLSPWAIAIELLTGTGNYYLGPGYVRGAYNHNDTRGVNFYMNAGYKGGVLAVALPGEDDGVVSMHSACGYNTSFSATKCIGDWRWCTKYKKSCPWRGCPKIPYPGKCTVGQWSRHYRASISGNDGHKAKHGEMADQPRFHRP